MGLMNSAKFIASQVTKIGGQSMQNQMSNELVVTGLTAGQTKALLEALAKRESGGNYNTENRYGYLGAYQLGAAALVDAGLVSSTKYTAATKTKAGIANGANATNHKAFLANESNWVLQGGKSAYLDSPTTQDNAVVKLMNRNAQTLSAKGVYTGTVANKAGLLMAAHLKGAGNAAKFAQTGKASQDGFGTSIKEYYELGANSVKGVA